MGELVLRPTFSEVSWSLASDPSDPTLGVEVHGHLDASAAAIAAWSAPPRPPTDDLSLRIEGSGTCCGLANPHPNLTLT